MIFNCGVIIIHSNCIYIIVLITLKMAISMAETCRGLLLNKNYINTSKYICWSFIYIYIYTYIHLINACYTGYIKM
jgi:hypothetical protein